MHRGPIRQSIHKFRELLLEPVDLSALDGQLSRGLRLLAVPLGHKMLRVNLKLPRIQELTAKRGENGALKCVPADCQAIGTCRSPLAACGAAGEMLNPAF